MPSRRTVCTFARSDGALPSLCLLIGCVSLPAFLISSKRLLERGHSPLALASSVFGVCALLFTAALGAMRWFARFSPEAHARAQDITRNIDCATLYWPVDNLAGLQGSREERLRAYRAVRDDITAKLAAYLPDNGVDEKSGET